ncbi:hypothetical protein [Nonomuraea sp. JJY05]|uniref:hypothetical protein n=1 Tax=Nonomuraea sp. JJY05 TaxID=3350255 RepID=UPI00373F4913
MAFPSLMSLARQAIPRLLEAVIIPLALFYTAWSGSAVVYFLQAELGTISLSMVFLASIWLRRPLVGKLIGEYVQLPQAVMAHERIRRCFVHLAVLWALVLLANATVSIWLLLSVTLGIYLPVRPGMLSSSIIRKSLATVGKSQEARAVSSSEPMALSGRVA